MSLSILGAAPVCDISKSGTRICATGPVTSERVTQSAAPVIPVVMAGIIAIYGLVVAVVITQDMLSTADFSGTLLLTVASLSPVINVVTCFSLSCCITD